MLKHESKSPQDWYQETIDAHLLNGKQLKSAQTCAREIRIFCKWLKGQPFEATEEDLRNFILYRRKDCNLSASSMKILIVAMRFFFKHIIPRDWKIFDTLKAPAREDKLPVVLTRQEVWRILENTKQLGNRVYFQTVYSCGLRLSEARRLTVHDIKAEQHRLYVRQAKGSRDRAVPLPTTTLLQLRKYYATHHNPTLLFPKLGRNQKGAPTATEPTKEATVQMAFKRAVKRAGITKPGVRIHTLRHSYATHLLEAGIHVRAIQQYLGHKSLETTLIYFHLTHQKSLDIFETIEDLMKGGDHGQDR